MILIFDLDDTLYDERTYVDSGLKAVSRYGEEQFDWDPEDSFRYMQEVLETQGRGKIFDLWLAEHGKASSTLVAECVKVYRHHNPSLCLFTEAQKLLPLISSKYPLYLVTDGHKIVQQKKVEALGISDWFRKVMITHRYGLHHAKPSTRCFELIRKKERCDWQEMVYVGDNPAKDFVNLNPLGMITIRVLTGMYRNTTAKTGYDAQISISNLGHLFKAIGLNQVSVKGFI